MWFLDSSLELIVPYLLKTSTKEMPTDKSMLNFKSILKNLSSWKPEEKSL
jgi:hypothetical protein